MKGKVAVSKPVTKPVSERTRLFAEDVERSVDAACAEFLNDTYRDLCRKLIAKLMKHESVPFASGTPNVWAAGVLRVITVANFLSRNDATPRVTGEMTDKFVGVSASSAAKRAGEIRSLLKVREFDKTWALPERLEDNPGYFWDKTANLLGRVIRAYQRGETSLPTESQIAAELLGSNESTAVPERSTSTQRNSRDPTRVIRSRRSWGSEVIWV